MVSGKWYKSKAEAQIIQDPSIALCRKSDLCIPRNETAQPRSKFLHGERFLYIPRIGLLFGCSKIGRSWEYMNRSQIHECGNWETEHYNYVLEIMRPRLFISRITGFSPALHLQCGPQIRRIISNPVWKGQHIRRSTC